MKNQMESNKKSKELVYEFLVKYFMDKGYAPSIREICEGTYLSSTSSVYSHLCKLEEEGRIEIRGNSPRATKLVGFKLIKEGTDMEDIKESNQIRNEIFSNVIATLKKDIPLLSEEDERKIEKGFYSGTEKYLFKRKAEG